MRYSPIEKLCCVLVWTTRRLRQYMLYHTTWLISKLDPLKYMIELTALNGRMTRCRAPDDYEPLNFDFPNEDLMFIATTEEDTLEDRHWKLNFDGGSNTFGNGVGAVLISSSGDHYPFTCKLDFNCINNMVEYEACIMGIRPVIDGKIKVLEVYGDSVRTLRRLASDYVLDGEILYKKRKDQVLLRCVDVVEVEKILEEVHEGVCGTHANGFTMARQIMRFRYYWSTMRGDYIRYAKMCHKCQIYGDKIHVPPSPLHIMTSTWSFSMWGMDVIGPISPNASNGHRFIFVVIDYFTKWVEAASYANVTMTTVSKFLKREIICRYGMPERIVSDNALNLNNSAIAEFCSLSKLSTTTRRHIARK
ncbi:reverse transcriptase [Gossypium australe]|uniref:Reverse transcriptase n=1 Tax=Gossypium australe TaxID=47621 RepID=A0A5B6W2B1_9ROSI|nr:reverse transcriptase [Gossypium australe]